MSRHRRDLDPADTAPTIDIAALRRSNATVEELDGLIFGTRLMEVRSRELADRFSDQRLRRGALSQSERLRLDVDALLDLRLEVA